MSLITLLPEIAAAGKKQAEEILKNIGNTQRLALQTAEFVAPAKQTAVNAGLIHEIGNLGKQVNGQESFAEKLNRLIYGDNLYVMQALLAEGYGGKIDLIYIDPPFQSGADYKTKIALRLGEIQQQPSVMEQKAYSDTWQDGTVSYLQMLYPRLVLMRELLSDKGSLYVHVDWHAGHYV
ncbi:MAG: hypothetical protein LBH00_10915, partial [Planctomycetaceae bacterium]|nr:hypothetical protein [Planctomycetaceae bacterium]